MNAVAAGTKIRVIGGKYDGVQAKYKRPERDRHIVIIPVWDEKKKKWWPYPALIEEFIVVGPER